MNKIVCIYHSIDLDGYMSAAIVKHWFIETNKPNNYIINGTETARGGNPHNPNSIDFIGYNYGQPIPDLSEYDKVIMCDISFPEYDIDCIIENDNKRLIWIDHHISAINVLDENIEGLRDTKFAACELTWQYFFPNESIPEIVRLLGRYDCFGHKGTEEELKVLEFQYGARNLITDYNSAYRILNNQLDKSGAMISFSDTNDGILTNGKAIYQYLCTEAKQIYKNGFEIKFLKYSSLKENSITVVNPETLKSEIVYNHYHKFICINRERFNPSTLGIDYHKDGYDGCACFHYDDVAKLWRFSLYNDNGQVDCSIIAKQYGGGGHKGAAGFVMTNEQFKNLISNL